MRHIAELILLHIWLGGWSLVMSGYIWGSLADREYDWRMQSRWRAFLMPGRWKERRCFVRWMKGLAIFGLAFGAAVYAFLLADFLHRA